MPESEFQPSDHVRFAEEICGVVEEVIWARNATGPVYLVEYWHNGEVVRVRLYEEQLEAA